MSEWQPIETAPRDGRFEVIPSDDRARQIRFILGKEERDMAFIKRLRRLVRVN